MTEQTDQAKDLAPYKPGFRQGFLSLEAKEWTYRELVIEVQKLTLPTGISLTSFGRAEEQHGKRMPEAAPTAKPDLGSNFKANGITQIAP
jgi:hypothetical protein